MSHVAYFIQGPVTNGTIVGHEFMSAAFERGYISVLFYSDEFETVVIPLTGTLTFEASETGEGFGTIVDGAVDASIEAYDRPNFAGSVKVVRATAAGITGALNYRARIDRYTSGGF